MRNSEWVTLGEAIKIMGLSPRSVTSARKKLRLAKVRRRTEPRAGKGAPPHLFMRCDVEAIGGKGAKRRAVAAKVGRSKDAPTNAAVIDRLNGALSGDTDGSTDLDRESFPVPGVAAIRAIFRADPRVSSITASVDTGEIRITYSATATAPLVEEVGESK